MNLYSTDELLGVVPSLKRPQRFLTQKFFPTVRRSTEAKVHIDVQKHKRRMAPFVHPRSQGRFIEKESYRTDSIVPAYIKPKAAYDPAEAIEHRTMGEALTGSLTPQQREDRWVAETMDDHLDMRDRRLEWMAAQALISSSITIVGDGYPAVVVNYGRDAGQSVALTLTDRWGEAGVDPLDDLQAWSLQTQKLCGAPIVDWVMEPDAWTLFRKSGDIKDLLDNRRGGERANVFVGPADAAEPTFMGSIGAFNFWVYQEWVVDPETDVESQLLPQYSVIGASPALMGRQHYGAIYDSKAGYRAVPYFPKMWEEEDPSTIILLGQSAPLIAPWRPDASFYATVR